jgi:hypothetical protein
VAVVAALADVDVAPGQLQRGVGLEALDRLRGGLLEEQRHDLDQAADGDHQQDQHDHQEVVGLDLLVTEGLVVCHVVSSSGVRRGGGNRRVDALPPATVITTFQAMISMPPRYSRPPQARIT